MATITVRLPDDTHKRIKELAATRKTSINKLYGEFTVMALTEFDAENRFRVIASKGSKKRGLDLLHKLQHHYGDK